ncbi:MAG: radical SAM protein [Anaerolineae bacterium]|nr:radical SAM protein [Anaerolineae bacterium]
MQFDAARNRLVLYPSMSDLRLGQCDCDCACDLSVDQVSPPQQPMVIRSQAASLSLDCDCACALDGSVVLAGSGRGLAETSGAAWDCDCACAVDLAHRPAVRSVASRWIKEPQIVSMPLDNGWQACFNPAGPVGVSALNAEAGQVLAAFDSPVTLRGAVGRLAGMPVVTALDAAQELIQIGLLRPLEDKSRHAASGMRHAKHAAQVAPSLRTVAARSSTLSAWLHVIEACNLRCPYCYVHKQPRAMTWEVGRHTIDRLVEIANRHGYSTLKLKYAGGEPTLNFSLIEALHACAAHRTADVGLTLEEVILTNGVGVTDAMLDFISRARMRLMVSLDGGLETHDRLRARPDGGSTYAAVTDTVERAMGRGLRPNISITVTSLNLEGAGEAVAFALERALPFNINFYRECAPDRSPAARGPLSPSPAQLLEAMRGILAVIRAYPTYPLPLTAILDRTRLDIPHSYACSAGRDYLVVGTAGQVSACQMLLEEPWSTLVNEDPLCAVRRRGEELFKAVDNDPECGACTWRTACSGGCPLLRKSVLHGDYCQVYRALLPELVQLEARRLIGQIGESADERAGRL